MAVEDGQRQAIEDQQAKEKAAAEVCPDSGVLVDHRSPTVLRSLRLRCVVLQTCQLRIAGGARQLRRSLAPDRIMLKGLTAPTVAQRAPPELRAHAHVTMLRAG
jgi:hypothetical protein